MTPLIYIHGANATARSFNFIRRVVARPASCLEYSCEAPLEFNIDRAAATLAQKGEPVDIIAHSLGGVVALGVESLGVPVRRMVTLATPFGGSTTADYLRFLYPGERLYRDISSTNPTLARLRGHKPRAALLSFITTAGGAPLFREPNDGVVSVASQRALPWGEKIEVEVNHFECLLDEWIGQTARSFLEG